MKGLIDTQTKEHMCSNFPSAAVIKLSDQKQSRERKIYSACMYRSQIIAKGRQGRHSIKNLKQRLGGTLFAGCWAHVYLAFLNSPGPHPQSMLLELHSCYAS